MDVRLALRQGRELLNEVGVGGWVLGLDRAKQRAGACHHGKFTITLSEHYVRLNDWDEVRVTVLHEAAHALAGPGHGHDAEWAYWCYQLGIEPKRCYGSEVAMPQGNVAIICPNHGEIGRRHRMPSAKMAGRYFCRKCKAPTSYKRVRNF